MRPAFIFLWTIVIVFACNNSDSINADKAADNEAYPVGNVNAIAERRNLIEQLKRLQQKLESGDKEKIASIFSFPISDSALPLFIDDSTYCQQFKANGNKTTKAMFLHYFKDISESIWLEPLKNLFQYIKVDSLLIKDTLEHAAYIKTEPCFYSYGIEINKNSVTLTMNMQSNKNWKSNNTSSEDDIPENSSENCEHNFWWVFNYDGKQLHFVSIGGAD